MRSDINVLVNLLIDAKFLMFAAIWVLLAEVTYSSGASDVINSCLSICSHVGRFLASFVRHVRMNYLALADIFLHALSLNRSSNLEFKMSYFVYLDVLALYSI